MIPDEFSEIARIFRSYDKFAVVAHFRPDGDAIGATLATGKMLQGMGKEVVMLNEDAVPDRYRFLEGSDEIITTPNAPIDADIVVSVDNGAWKRLGDRTMKALEGIKTIVNIDHHDTNECFGAVNCVQAREAAACCIIYDLLKYMGLPLTPSVSNALYVGISTDTGSFQYEKTTPKLMRAVADLLENGVQVMEVNRNLYQEIPYKTLLMTREVLNSMQLEENGTICSYALDEETKHRIQPSPDNTADLVDVIRVIQGVKVAAIFEDMGGGVIRVSLRSKDVRLDVSAVAAQFGGGGHKLAAGIRMRCPLEEARSRVLEAIRIACRAINV